MTLEELENPKGVKATLSGTGTGPARIVTCSNSVETTLNAQGESAEITCGSTTVTALYASPTIELRKPPTGVKGKAIQVKLKTGQTATIGSPIQASSENTEPILVEILDENENVIGQGELFPGQILEVNLESETGEIILTNLSETPIEFTLDGEVLSLKPGEETKDYCPGISGNVLGTGCPYAILSQDDLHVHYDQVKKPGYSYQGYACLKEVKKGKKSELKEFTHCKLPLQLGSIGDSRKEEVKIAQKKVYPLEVLLQKLGVSDFGKIKSQCQEIFENEEIKPLIGTPRSMTTNEEIIGVPEKTSYLVIEKVGIFDPALGKTFLTYPCKVVEEKDFKKEDVAKRKIKVLKKVKPTEIEFRPVAEEEEGEIENEEKTEEELQAFKNLSIWVAVEKFFGGPKEKIYLLSKEIAEKNKIAVPEWKLNNGETDHRKIPPASLIEAILDFLKQR